MKLSKQKTGRRLALEAGAAVLVALGLDILGEPPASWHPVAWYGKLIQRLAFFHALRDIGLHLIPSRTHFCLIEVGDAHHVRQQLLDRKILVRNCASFGLPQFVRVATRPMRDWQQLLIALQEMI